MEHIMRLYVCMSLGLIVKPVKRLCVSLGLIVEHVVRLYICMSLELIVGPIIRLCVYMSLSMRICTCMSVGLIVKHVVRLYINTSWKVCTRLVVEMIRKLIIFMVLGKWRCGRRCRLKMLIRKLGRNM